jgi:hypothetical protein
VTDPQITFAAEPSSYRHWGLVVDGAVATLTMQVTRVVVLIF